jgi:hypothetical protein
MCTKILRNRFFRKNRRGEANNPEAEPIPLRHTANSISQQGPLPNTEGKHSAVSVDERAPIISSGETTQLGRNMTDATHPAVSSQLQAHSSSILPDNTEQQVASASLGAHSNPLSPSDQHPSEPQVGVTDVSQAPVAESHAQNPQEDSSSGSKWSERGRIILSTVKKTLNVAEKMLDGFPIPGVKGAVAVVRDIIVMVEVRYTLSIVVNFNHISNPPTESR